MRNTKVEHRLDGLVTTAHNIANDDAVRPRVELRRIKPLMDLDAKFPELGTHWWVHGIVAPSHLESGSARERSYATHECSADSQYVYVHAVTQGDEVMTLYRTN